jgi:two-component system, cell cycle sensor histidine kinase and response regulator CckA
VLNLMLNAHEACAEGGAIRVSTARAGGRGAVPEPSALLRITDDGEGIAAGDLKNIFDPFFTTKKSRQGNGLGLSICWTIVKRAGGDIRVSSLPGRGTEVEVVLRCT